MTIGKSVLVQDFHTEEQLGSVHLHEYLREMLEDVARAIQVFETKPGFASMQVQLRNNIEECDRHAAPLSRVWGSQQCLELVIARYDINAKAWLTLVSDIETQNAFGVVLRQLARYGCEQYAAAPPECIRSPSEALQQGIEAIYARIAVWFKAGYQSLANSDQEQTTLDSRLPQSDAAAVGQDLGLSPRRTAVNNYIQEVVKVTGQQISRADLWREAGYKDPTAFERWERNDRRGTAKADRAFKSVLVRKPHIKKK